MGHFFFVNEKEADAAPVLLWRADGRVVHLKDKLRPGGNFLGPAWWRNQRARAWGKAGQEDQAAWIAFVTFRLGWPRTRRLDIDNDVMHDRPVAGHALGQLDPLVLRETWIDDEGAVWLNALGFHVRRFFGHVDDLVRLARQKPVVAKFSRRRQFRRVSFGAAVVDPRTHQLL